MTLLERAAERVITEWGMTASLLMNADSRWRRALGLLLALCALCIVVAVLAIWLIFGKKPK